MILSVFQNFDINIKKKIYIFLSVRRNIENIFKYRQIFKNIIDIYENVQKISKILVKVFKLAKKK